jgi:2-oxoisovalerate dehydrogenase E2 component (dihydrolipoyl transacylase)
MHVRCPPNFRRGFHSTLSSEAGKIPFLLADIGEGIKEVEVLQWHVAPGDRVQQFDPICTVQSDKATVEITSRYDGVIASLASDAPGAMLQVGQPLLYFESEKDEAPAPNVSAPPAVSEAVKEEEDEILDAPFSVAEETFSRPDSANSVHASPAVRKLCREHGIALDAIPGTGPQGRVLKSDVLVHLEAMNGEATTTSPSDQSVSPSHQPQEGDQVIPIRGMRRLMVQTMTSALQIPHMCFGEEVCLNELIALRKQWNKQYEKNEVPSPSLLAWIIKALSAALRDYPLLNAIHTINPNDGSFSIVQRHDQNIGVAMDTPHGLVVPVVKSCQRLSLDEIEAQLLLLKRLAHENQLTPAQIQDRTFTLSNIGSIGSGAYMQPVLVPPVLAMGTLGRMRTVPRYNEAMELYPAAMMPVTWAGDHRFVDGASLGRFHNRFAEYIEEPFRMISQWK